MSRNRNTIFIGIGLVLSTLAALYAFLIRPWQLRWGTTNGETTLSLPGDELIPFPRLNATHAISINAPPETVWSWLVQIGQGRGGFYNYDWVENAMGLDIQTANQIFPEYQELQVGDLIPLSGDGIGLPVAILDAGKTHVLHGDTRTDPSEIVPNIRPGDYLAVSWGFYLIKSTGNSTRLVERWRADWNPNLMNSIFYRLFLEPGAFIMERKMLLGIKARAEENS